VISQRWPTASSFLLSQLMLSTCGHVYTMLIRYSKSGPTHLECIYIFNHRYCCILNLNIVVSSALYKWIPYSGLCRAKNFIHCWQCAIYCTFTYTYGKLFHISIHLSPLFYFTLSLPFPNNHQHWPDIKVDSQLTAVEMLAGDSIGQSPSL